LKTSEKKSNILMVAGEIGSIFKKGSTICSNGYCQAEIRIICHGSSGFAN
jgi:hypothetical protein